MYNFSTMLTKVPLTLRAVSCALLLQACSPAATQTINPEPTASAKPILVPSLEATAVPTSTATATAQPTAGPIATVWPPVFASGSLGDIRELSSFIVTVNGKDRTYAIDGWTYSLTGSGDWYISASTNGDTSDQIEGDFYLAKDGDYVLYSHWRETRSQGNFTQVVEVSKALSSINGLTEIKIPADMTEMVKAAHLPAEMSLPLPQGSAPYGMIRYKNGIGVDLYQFTAPRISIDEFLEYYRNLPPTDGWEVTHVGHVNLHQDDCEVTRECVIIRKGSTQVVLYYNGGSIRAEFDWPHLYRPL